MCTDREGWLLSCGVGAVPATWAGLGTGWTVLHPPAAEGTTSGSSSAPWTCRLAALLDAQGEGRPGLRRMEL